MKFNRFTLGVMFIIAVLSLGCRSPHESTNSLVRKKIGLIAQALELHKKDMRSYPNGDGGEDSLKCLLTPPSGTDETTIKNWPYVRGGGRTLDDPWGNPYRYRFPGRKNPEGFDLWSNGPDGKSDSDDDIGNW